ncbi:MAG: hypothetical protein Kow00121_31810 [Elainellaceae cyanobacterium]
MSSEPNIPETPTTGTSAIVEVEPKTDAIVETEPPEESDDIQRETKALIEAIRRRAQSEAQTAGDFTRETYLRLVREARESIEQNRLFDPEQIERSAEQLRQDAENNWQALVQEVGDLSDRLSEAAKAAWEKLVQPQDPPPNY